MTVLSLSELELCTFGQPHPYTQKFFFQKNGVGKFPSVRSFPHYDLLIQNEKGTPFSSEYTEYIKASWGTSNPDIIKKQIEKILIMVAWFKETPSNEIPPITLTETVSGTWAVVDGNHRISMAVFFGKPIKAKILGAREFLKRNIILTGKDFYAGGTAGVPYQSLFDTKGNEIIIGRRRDIWERVSKIDLSDIVGKTVLDIGCNFGANSFLAASRGAISVIGVDINQKIILAACRNNVWFQTPCVFLTKDLCDNPFPDKFDTVFCFSVLAHVKDKKAFLKNLDDSTKETLYFEGHSGTKSDCGFLHEMFSSVKFLGYNCDGAHTISRTRPFFRCSKKI